METRPFWKTRITAIVLVAPFVRDDLVLALLIVFGGPLGQAIADKAGLGGAFTLLWAIVRWPIAFVAVLLLFALIYYYAPNVDAAAAGSGSRPARSSARCCGSRSRGSSRCT